MRWPGTSPSLAGLTGWQPDDNLTPFNPTGGKAMGVTERRERERQETRQLILEAARELFVREGYEAVSMRKIAEKIEYSAPAIYHHFRDKESLLAELCLHDFRALAGAFLRIGRIDDPVERIRRIGEAYVEFGLENPSQYRFMFMAEHPEPGTGDALELKGNPEQDAYAFLRLAVREAIEQRLFRPELDNVDLVSQMLWASVHGIVSLHIAHEQKADWIEWQDPRATAQAMMDVTMRGLLRVGR